MSGPGGFVGLTFARCIPMKGTATGIRGEAARPETAGDPQQRGEPQLGALIYCPEVADVEKYLPHWTLYAIGGLSGSYHNGLQRNGGTHAVWVIDLGAAMEYTVLPWMAIGAGGGVNHFVGKDFRGFTRPYVEPYVAIRPVLFGKSGQVAPAATRREAILRSFIVTAGWRVLFADLDGGSFGAPDDTSFHAHNEGRPTLGLGIDLVALFRKK
jgi:hypothetical protein